MNYLPGVEPPPRTGAELLALLDKPEPPRDKGLRFSVCVESGWLRGTASAVRVCCALWNMRSLIRRAVRLHAALTTHKGVYVQLLTLPGTCTCLTKIPLPEYHARDCVYAAITELGGEQ